jgi:hypothetical protein
LDIFVTNDLLCSKIWRTVSSASWRAWIDIKPYDFDFSLLYMQCTRGGIPTTCQAWVWRPCEEWP